VRSARRHGGLILTAGLSVVVVCLVHAQQAPAELVKLSRIERLAAWIAAVERHEPGQLDEPALMVNEWGAGELRFLWFDVTSLTSLVREPDVLIFFAPQERPIGVQQPNAVQQSVASARRFPQLSYTVNELGRLRAIAKTLGGRTDGRENTLLRRGAVLHADIAMLAPMPPARSSGLSSSLDRYIVRMDDGRQVGLETRTSHWEMGRRLLDRIAVRRDATNRVLGPEADGVARAWYVAAEAYMQSIGDLDPRNCQRAIELFPKDAEMLFFCGALHEVLAGPRRQAALRTADIPSGVTMMVGPRGDELSAAERLYRRALEANDGFDEARIRHARVLGRRGRHAEAVDELKKITSAKEPVLEYYAALFLAGELEAVGNEDAARQAYFRAVKLFPHAQSPRLGLSRLGASPSEQQAARSAALALVSDPSVETDRADPWWTYEYEQGRHRDALLVRLYEAVQEERRQ
jgi:hypothetical protein